MAMVMVIGNMQYNDLGGREKERERIQGGTRKEQTRERERELGERGS